MGCPASAGQQRAFRGRRPGRSVKDELNHTTSRVHDVTTRTSSRGTASSCLARLRLLSQGPLLLGRAVNMNFRVVNIVYGKAKLRSEEYETFDTDMGGRKLHLSSRWELR